MAKYANRGGDSGITDYECGKDYIQVSFRDGSVYVYTAESAGVENIEQMKRLAQEGEGLNSYINRYARKRYAYKK